MRYPPISCDLQKGNYFLKSLNRATVLESFKRPSLREEAPRPCTGVEALGLGPCTLLGPLHPGPHTLGPLHQTACHIPNPSAAASPLHLSAKHESSFLIVNRLAAQYTFDPFRAEEEN